MVYEIPLAEQKVKTHQVTALHLMTGFALLAAGAFIMSAFFVLMIMPFSWQQVPPDSNPGMHSVLWPEYLMLAAGVFILLPAMFRNKWLLQSHVNRAFRMFELLACAGIAIAALYTQAWVLGGIFTILAVAIVYAISVEKPGAKAVVVRVDETGIRLPAISRRRHIEWTDAELVLLRHGTLTINAAGNNLYQWMTRANDIDTAAFEAYCVAEIQAAKKQKGEHSR